MFKSKFIRDCRGSMFGRIDEDDHGSRAYDRGGRYLGRYDRNVDHMYDNAGHVVTISGDALSSSIFTHRR